MPFMLQTSENKEENTIRTHLNVGCFTRSGKHPMFQRTQTVTVTNQEVIPMKLVSLSLFVSIALFLGVSDTAQANDVTWKLFLSQAERASAKAFLAGPKEISHVEGAGV